MSQVSCAGKSLFEHQLIVDFIGQNGDIKLACQIQDFSDDFFLIYRAAGIVGIYDYYSPCFLGDFSSHVVDVRLPTIFFISLIGDWCSIEKLGVRHVWWISWSWKEDFVA